MSERPKQYEILNVKETNIKDVWASNFEEELYKIMDLTKKYNVIAMDTEFPGVNSFPPNSVEEKDFEYALIQKNVNRQKIIQIGISISDEEGNVPKDDVFTWQFNFQFDEQNDEISQESKNLLKTAGIKFDQFLKMGLTGREFSEFCIGSGIAMNDDLKWVAFHGGFDFGYFLKMLYGQNIPEETDKFLAILKSYFPQIYDIKYLVKDTIYQDQGLQRLAIESLKIQRLGPQHQAGSDSLLTLKTFFKLKSLDIVNFEDRINVIYGIGQGYNKDKPDHYLKRYQNLKQQNDNSQSNQNFQNPHYYMDYDMQMYNMPFMQNFGQLSFNNNYNQYQFMDDNNMHHKQDSFGRKKNQNY